MPGRKRSRPTSRRKPLPAPKSPSRTAKRRAISRRSSNKCKCKGRTAARTGNRGVGTKGADEIAGTSGTASRGSGSKSRGCRSTRTRTRSAISRSQHDCSKTDEDEAKMRGRSPRRSTQRIKRAVVSDSDDDSVHQDYSPVDEYESLVTRALEDLDQDGGTRSTDVVLRIKRFNKPNEVPEFVDRAVRLTLKDGVGRSIYTQLKGKGSDGFFRLTSRQTAEDERRKT